MSVRDRLRDISIRRALLHDVNTLLRMHDNPTAFELIAHTLGGRWGLSALSSAQGVYMWESSSTAAKPACIVISANHGQAESPSAVFVYEAALFIIQVFEGGADDTKLVGECETPQNWFQTENRLLFC